jgi:hypothetical protein
MSNATTPGNTPGSTPGTDEAQQRTARREADSQRDATTLQSPVADPAGKPPGDDGGTRTRSGSNYGDWVPDKREPDHPDVRHPEEMPLTPPPEGTSPLQGEFERGPDNPRVK